MGLGATREHDAQPPLMAMRAAVDLESGDTQPERLSGLRYQGLRLGRLKQPPAVRQLRRPPTVGQNPIAADAYEPIRQKAYTVQLNR